MKKQLLRPTFDRLANGGSQILNSQLSIALTSVRYLPALLTLLTLATLATRAFPPAPHHLFFGLVRDEYGNPLNADQAEVILETDASVQVKTKIVPGLDPGVNYRLAVPMDAGITSDLYKPTALRPTVPFKFKVKIGATVYLPIEMTADYSRMGRPGERTRLNLTLGEDSDGDGLPDAWERAMMAAPGLNMSLADFKPNSDLDRDGLSNLDEYLAGTYAFDPADGFSLKIAGYHGGSPALEFMGIRGRTYSILGSQDMVQWFPVAFKLSGASEPALIEYYAHDVRTVRVEIPSAEPQTPAFKFFKLMAR